MPFNNAGPSARCGRSPSADGTGPFAARTRAAIALPPYTLIETAKLNDVDPQAWLTDVLARLPDHPAKRLDELLALELEGQPIWHSPGPTGLTHYQHAPYTAALTQQPRPAVLAGCVRQF